MTVKAFVVVACSVVCLSVGLLWAAQGYEERVLESFEGADALSGWEAGDEMSLVTEHATEGTKALKVALEKMGSSVGVDGRRWDLTGYDKLKLDITNDGPPVIITLRAKDRAGATYQSWYYLVKTGYNRVEYIIDGFASALDISQFNSLDIRIDAETPKPVTFFIDNIRASRGADDDSWLLPKERPPAVLEVPGNLIENASFELGMEQWGSWGQWDGGKYTFGSGSGPDAHSGGSSASIICQKPGRGGIYTKPMRLPAPGTYQVVVYLKGRDGARFRTSAANGQLVGAREFEVPDRWTEIEYKVEVEDPSNDFRLYIYNVGAGTLYVDDVVLLPLDGVEAAVVTAREVKGSAPVISIDGDVMTVNGKPFFPIGIYGCSDPETQLAGTAFNLVTGGATSSSGQGYLDACARAGVYSWVNFTGLTRGHVPWQAGDLAARVKDHPALLAWYLCDEPDHAGWNVPPPELRLARKVIAEEDGRSHPAITLVMAWTPSNLYQYRDTCDILASDPYCIKAERPCDLHYVSRCVDTMRAAVHDEKPVWAVLHAGWDVTAEPTREEEYAMTYLAVAHGADGILWFALGYALNHPDLWQTLKDLAAELKALNPVLTAKTVWTKARQPAGHPAIHAILKETDDAYFLIAVNVPDIGGPEDGPKTLLSKDLTGVALPVGEVKATMAKVWFEDREVSLSEGTITDDFKLYERHVYEIAK